MRDRLPTPGKENRVKITLDDGRTVEGVLSYADDATQEGSAYTKGNVLPDMICNTLGIPTTSEPKDAFNVLAHIGNMHVWKRTEHGEWTYHLSDVVTSVIRIAQGSNNTEDWLYSDSIAIDNEGGVSLVDPQTTAVDAYNPNTANVLKGKFAQAKAPSSPVYAKLVKFPDDVVFSRPGGENYLNASKYQNIVTSQSKEVSFLTSTNRNAYQEGSDAKPAGYTLGELVTGEFLLGSPTRVNGHRYEIADTIEVSEIGSISAGTNVSTLSMYEGARPSESAVVSAFAGKFVRLSDYVNTATSPPDTKPPFDSVPSSFVYIPEDISCGTTSDGKRYITKYQSVLAYPAIPANTTIEYLGQIGDKTQIHFGSYVGTGKYNKSNSTRIAFPFSPQWVFIFFRAPSANKSIVKDPVLAIFDRTINPTNDGTTIKWSPNSTAIVHVTWESDKTISFYSTEDANKQLNSGGYIYHYVAIS